MIDLMKIFEGNVRNYHTLNLNTDHGKDSFTMAEIEYFARLGSMLGYYSFTEDTCNGRNRPMDLTWWDSKSGEEWDDFVLHLESYFDVVHAYLLNGKDVRHRAAHVKEVADTLFMELEQQ